jgi:hypothetical protein
LEIVCCWLIRRENSGRVEVKVKFFSLVVHCGNRWQKRFSCRCWWTWSTSFSSMSSLLLREKEPLPFFLRRNNL